MNIICMLNLLKKNYSAVACQCTCVPSTKKRMSVSSVLHRSCDSDPGGALFRWLDCFDIQFLLLSAAALESSGPLGSHALLVSRPPEHQSRKERWAAVSFLDKEKVFPRIDNAETSTSRETTRSPARWFAARSLLVSCPPGTMVSSYRRSSLSFLAASLRNEGSLSWFRARLVPAWTGVSWERWAARFLLPLLRRAAICIRCRCLTRLVFASVTSSFGNTEGKLFTKFKKTNGEHLFDLLRAAGQYVTAYAVSAPLPLSFRTFTCARTVARASIDLGVQRRETADKCEQTTDTTVL